MPYLSRKREQIIKRDNKPLLKDNHQRLMAKKTAIKANAIEDAKGHNADINKLAKGAADKERQQKGLSRMSWRGEPLAGLA